MAEESVREQHADLMPELAKELRMLRLLEASRPPQMVDELVALQAKLRPDGGSVNKDKDIDARTEAEPPRRSVPSLTGCADSKRSSRQRCYHKNVARLAIQVAHGLEYSHQKGLVHRDVKPSNLLLDTLGHIWITDFGLAKPNRGGFTSTGKLVGTLRYMAPEQIEGRCDSRADVYSLGITLFELLTLQPAFSGSGYLDTIDCICHKGPLPPRKLEPSIPRDLETIVLKAIERDADTRYQTAQELADELQKFLDGKPIAAKRRGVAESLLKWIQRNIGTSSLIAALLLLLALSWIALAVVWFQAEKFKKSLNRPLPEPTAVHAADETAKK